jgi:hypothetical protein
VSAPEPLPDDGVEHALHGHRVEAQCFRPAEKALSHGCLARGVLLRKAVARLPRPEFVHGCGALGEERHESFVQLVDDGAQALLLVGAHRHRSSEVTVRIVPAVTPNCSCA